MKISPKYLVRLINKIEEKIWDEFHSYRDVKGYIKKWYECDNWNYENFRICYKDTDNKEIDLNETLHGIDGETLLKIAIDLGIETPDFIPAVAVIKNVLKDKYKTAFDFFQKAIKKIEEDPDLSVGLANSTLESIVKHILENDRFSTEVNKKNTLYDLIQIILKEFCLFPCENIPNEIKNIGSGLLTISKNIEDIRSDKTTFHGKTKEDYIIQDQLYAYFIVNVISTIGLFLMSFYEKKYNNADIYKKGTAHKPKQEAEIDDIPF